ncbi:HIT family protein [Roseibacillus ishigakijimensis]|uniref:HIT family protein n=1 Tax=Roseibacillus ishigakijimensis TaxID=454146 RepID=A0A934RWD8_9BACT|nr:HIT family protein [Roseibacillus ishigakijimensis]MBK1835656.1 HIT family protein [Roseibacillus ishigakijimensis]
MAFEVHPRLLKSSLPLGRSRDCHILLKNNRHFPWLLVVPEVAGGEEDWHQLSEARAAEVMAVVREVSLFVENYFRPEKLNIACIGNQVRQMHWHIVGRSPGDAAWPGVVWSSEAKELYSPERLEEITAAFVGLDSLNLAK